jgi:hypothetical protein
MVRAASPGQYAARRFDMKRQVLKSWLMLGGVVCAFGVVGFASMGEAQTGDPAAAGAFRCTDRTIRGNYGFSIDGTVLAGTPGAFLLRGVAMTHFDGAGNLSQVDFATRNGAPMFADWRSAVGTYAINPDCTGTAEIVPSDGSPTLHLRLVVVDQGREIRTIVVGNATGSVGIRVN